jgi:exopolysaccharide biosynthesis polyprenyl glycosylphosphotransferase
MEALEGRLAAAGAARQSSDRSRSISAFAFDKALSLLLSDVAMFALASYVAVAFVSYLSRSVVYSHVVESAVIWIAVSVWTFKNLGLYRIYYALDYRDEWYYVVAGLALGVVPLLALYTVVPALSSSRLVLLTSFAMASVLVGTSRCIIHYQSGLRAGRRKRRIALVAASPELARISSAIDDGSTVLTLVQISGVDNAINEALAGSTQSWYDKALERGCDEIVFAGMPTARSALMVERAARDRVAVGFAPGGLSSQPYQLSFLSSRRQPILSAGRVAACTPINQVLKRIFDVTVATLGLAITWPLIAAAAIGILIESGRPVIFRQTRVGRNGKPFEILKLRSMTVDAEAKCGAVWAVGDPTKDARATKIGALIRKTSIDELPQFFNVLKGDMSIVGPRPERPIFVEQFRRQFPRYEELYLVRPGITGWAQVHMRRGFGVDQVGERLDLDLFYIENYSPLLDICLTFKTAVEVLFARWG